MSGLSLPHASDSESGPPTQGRADVFVVEDDPLSALMLNDLLEIWGFTISGMARSAPEAITALERHRPKLVLMDVRLADQTDGIVAAQTIRDRFGLRSLFITAHNDRATLDRMQKVNPLGVLIKPYSHEALRQALDAALSPLGERSED